jgi:hypothetical protein
MSAIERDEHGNVTVKVPAATGTADAPTPTIHITVLLGALFDGFDQARARFQQAQAEREGAGVTYVPLFEALAWTTAINDRLKAEWGQGHGGSQAWWDGLPNSDVALAHNFARNCVLHDWADALQLDESGVAFPISFPMKFHEWRWRAGLTSRNAEKPDKPGQAAYDSRLAGVPARDTLDAVRALFAAGAARP